jgi:hypothetical protein
MSRFKVLIISILLLCIFSKHNTLYAQKPLPIDSLKQAEREKHSPRRATIYSAILPGLGQVYNKKYWKIPIIYGGFAALTYSYIFNDGKYSDYLHEFTYRNTQDSANFNPNMLKYKDENILELKNSYQKSRELTIIGFVVLYALNIIDATVDGHLYAFDISDNLSMNIDPYLAPNNYNRLNGGITFTFSPKINRHNSQKSKFAK